MKTSSEISIVIDELRSARNPIQTRSKLLMFTAETLSRNKSSKMSVSTLYRNPRYRNLLDVYLSSITNIKYNRRVEELIDQLEYDQKHNALKIENEKLKLDIDELNAHPLAENGSNPSVKSNSAIDDLCRCIALLIDRSEGKFIVDLESGEIIDSWAKSKKNRVVVPKKNASHFVHWFSGFPKFIQGEND